MITADASGRLTALFDNEHKHGAELTRSVLLRARMTPSRNR
ncbi:hypothetical protein ACWDA7_47070 [Streptomyces sp. NPDC001156]